MLQGRVLIDEPPRRTYGFGIVEFERAGLRVVEHGGFAGGFATLVRLVPERRFAVVAFVNAAAASPTSVADAAMSAFLGVRPQKPIHDLPSPTTLGKYSGVWEDKAGALGKFDIIAASDRIVGSSRGIGSLPFRKTPGALHRAAPFHARAALAFSLCAQSRRRTSRRRQVFDSFGQ